MVSASCGDGRDSRRMLASTLATSTPAKVPPSPNRRAARAPSVWEGPSRCKMNTFRARGQSAKGCVMLEESIQQAVSEAEGRRELRARVLPLLRIAVREAMSERRPSFGKRFLDFLNSSFGIAFFTSVVVASASYWWTGRVQDEAQAEARKLALREANAELRYRSELITGAISVAEVPTPEGLLLSQHTLLGEGSTFAAAVERFRKVPFLGVVVRRDVESERYTVSEQGRRLSCLNCYSAASELNRLLQLTRAEPLSPDLAAAMRSAWRATEARCIRLPARDDQGEGKRCASEKRTIGPGAGSIAY